MKVEPTEITDDATTEPGPANRADGASPMADGSEPDPVMAAIAAAQELALAGSRDGARDAFARLWTQVGADGDPLHRVAIAHYLADLQDDPADELDWDERALAAADSLTDERAQQYHAALAVRGFYPSLHLNLAADLEKLDRLAEARAQLTLAQERLVDLPEGGYGDLIRSGITAMRERLSPGEGAAQTRHP